MNRFKKIVLTGTLVVSSLVGTGVVSAAPYTASGQDSMWTILQKNGISLESLIQSNPQVYRWQGTSDGNSSQAGSNTGNNWQAGSNTGNNWQAGSNAGNNSQAGTSYGKRWHAGTSDGNNSQAGSDAGNNWQAGSNAGNNWQAGSNAGNNSQAGSNAGNNSQAGSKAGNSSQAGTTTGTNSSFVSQVISMVNQERAKAGLQAVSSNNALAGMALDKAKDMYNSNYFDHNSPKYGSPFNMMTSYGIKFSYAGENIAKGQRNPQEVMTSWMNSTGHRDNILNSHFTKIGVAYYNGEWVQEFTN